MIETKKLRAIREMTDEEALEIFEVNNKAGNDAQKDYVNNPYPEKLISPYALARMAIEIVVWMRKKGFDVEINKNEHQN